MENPVDGVTALKMETAKKMVEEILATDERARNDDLWLILQIWQKKQFIKCFIPFEKMKEMISPETITRVRRKINEQGKFLPTDPKVLARRINREKEVKDWAVKQ